EKDLPNKDKGVSVLHCVVPSMLAVTSRRPSVLNATAQIGPPWLDRDPCTSQLEISEAGGATLSRLGVLMETDDTLYDRADPRGLASVPVRLSCARLCGSRYQSVLVNVSRWTQRFADSTLLQNRSSTPC